MPIAKKLALDETQIADIMSNSWNGPDDASLDSEVRLK
jgi:hypothetical protein